VATLKGEVLTLMPYRFSQNMKLREIDYGKHICRHKVPQERKDKNLMCKVTTFQLLMEKFYLRRLILCQRNEKSI
jgi:hypothetical protein